MGTHTVRDSSILQLALQVGSKASFNVKWAATVNAASYSDEVPHQANIWWFFNNLVGMPEQDRVALLNRCQLVPIQDHPDYYPYRRSQECSAASEY
jgi:hypothetical protein